EAASRLLVALALFLFLGRGGGGALRALLARVAGDRLALALADRLRVAVGERRRARGAHPEPRGLGVGLGRRRGRHRARRAEAIRQAGLRVDLHVAEDPRLVREAAPASHAAQLLQQAGRRDAAVG